MAAGRASYEIQVMKDGRWSTESVRDEEKDAVLLARRFLTDKKCEGAKVVRNWTRADGKITETEVFAQQQSVREDGEIRIAQVDAAPAKCEAPDDYVGLQSRVMMNRLFRNYMEKVFVTPTELIHNYKELKRLQDKDTLLPSAVDRVAFLQTKEGEQDSRSRRDEIFKEVDHISARARRADGMTLPKLNGCFREMYDKVAGLAEADVDADYLAMVVLSRDLVNVRNWVGKLDRLCRLAVEEGDPHSLQLLDGVIADVLGANIVQEILGWQPSLAAAIGRMFDLAEGNMPTDGSEAAESVDMLNRLFKEHKLPASRLCMIDRAHRQLRSANPLYRSDASKELEAFGQVVLRVLTPAGLLFGPETAEALTTRYTRMVVEGGAAGRRAAIIGVFNALPDRAYGLMYLCELAATDFAAEHLDDIVAALDRVYDARGLSQLCVRSLPPKERMMRATNAHKVAMASVFPDEIKIKLADHIDGVLERYLIDEQIVEKLDHQDSPLRDRAVRLVQFCAAGVLPEGRAMTRARQRILKLLRQANFDAHFVDGIDDPVKAQKTLRDFHQLLVRAGFGG
ncbi:hypothetical protein [Magnetospirillum sp. UT-4]|uniref:hypothetical protein n=1 Tax=Magnetospirillum sp. UT-4 TaxID=2681467 RepID=UPI0013815858|nr:hypothetical protein [Magnetospirillum sp. UT-4]CAA7623383.1 conserved hypothetical protein [Magnetospirillum sp. UT-4]